MGGEAGRNQAGIENVTVSRAERDVRIDAGVVEAVLLGEAELAAELEGVAAVDLGDVVGEFVHGRVTALWKGGQYGCGPSVEADHRTGFALRPVEVRRRTLVAVAELVHRGGVDGPVPTACHSPTLAALRARDLAGHYILRAVERVDRRVALPTGALKDVHLVVQVVVAFDGELVGETAIGEVENIAGDVQPVGVRAIVVVGCRIEL